MSDHALSPGGITHTVANGEYSALAIQLTEYPAESIQYLVGTLLGYWGRERDADVKSKTQDLRASRARLLRNPEALVGLAFDDFETEGRSRLAAFDFPPQRVGHELKSARGVFIATGTGRPSLASIYDIDEDRCRVRLRWPSTRDTEPGFPDRLIADGWVNPTPKPAVLAQLADDLLEDRPVNRVTLDVLAAAPPRFVEGGGPAGGLFTDSVEQASQWVTQLDDSYVAVQGPPGTGKTYLGSHLAYALICAGYRVGITAMSHAAVENMLEATIELFRSRGDLDLLHAAKKVSEVPAPANAIEGVTYVTENAAMASRDFNLISGTTWLFASPAVLTSSVDTLLIDEAGQLSLADAVVASCAASNVVLLGDPLQLTQVVQSPHPGVAARSVLEHVLDGASMVDSSRGVFLSTTRRMHPLITSYISERFYGGRLGYHPGCAVQDVAGEGVGLRYIEATHKGCTTEAPVEVGLVRQRILDLLGRDWTTADGTVRPLGPRDFMVVAPYNDQVDLLRSHLDELPETRRVPVGTVDKFQGREAPVVFYTMTASSRREIQRGVEFLYSPNRLNVAVSRARGLVYLVAARPLVDPDPSPGDFAHLIDHVSDLVERVSA